MNNKLEIQTELLKASRKILNEEIEKTSLSIPEIKKSSSFEISTMSISLLILLLLLIVGTMILGYVLSKNEEPSVIRWIFLLVYPFMFFYLKTHNERLEMIEKLKYNIPRYLLFISVLLISVAIYLMADFSIKELDGTGNSILNKDYVMILPLTIFLSLIMIIAIHDTKWFKNLKYKKIRRQASLLIYKSEKLSKIINQDNEPK